MNEVIQPLNIIVIGTGMYSTGRGTSGFGTILPAIVEWKRAGAMLGEVTLVGTSGPNSQQAEQKVCELSKQTGVVLNFNVYPKGDEHDNKTYKKVISTIEKPACAIVVVPDHLHYEVTRDCLEAGLHVLVVKPLTPTVEEGKKLVNLAKQNGLYAAVEFHKRWDRANLMLRDAIQNDRLGDLLYGWVEYSQRKSIPTKVFRAWTEKTSILQYLGVHYIDIVRFVTKATPIRVMATGQKNWLHQQGLDAYDSIQCVIEWLMPDGKRFTETILTNWIDPETSSSMSDQKIKVVGTKGRFESDQKERGIRINTDDNNLEQPNPDYCMAYGNSEGDIEWRGYGIESVTTFFEDIISINKGNIDIKDLELFRPTFSEALISTAVLEAAAASLEANNSWKEVAGLEIEG